MFKERAEKQTGLKLAHLMPGQYYEVGRSYYIGYWAEIDKCIEADNYGNVVVVGEDGTHRGHFTRLNYKTDFIVID